MRYLIVITALLCAGCASYVTPGAAVPLEKLDRANVSTGSPRQPAPQFPASVAVVRVQAPAYRSYSSAALGAGSFSVIATPQAPPPNLLKLIDQWPAVDQAQVLNSAWLPAKLESIDDLRSAAAKMQADVLLVYTVDTVFQVQGQAIAPDGSIALGAKQTGPATVAVATSAVFVDVRTGFVYGHADAKASADVADLLKDAAALDRKRLEVEGDAVTALLSTTGKAIWTGLAQQYQ